LVAPPARGAKALPKPAHLNVDGPVERTRFTGDDELDQLISGEHAVRVREESPQQLELAAAQRHNHALG